MTQTEFLTNVFQGNIEAVRFISILGAISQTWDDIIDKDKELTSHEINEMMWQALVYLPENKFYIDNFAELQPLIRSCISDFMVSNQTKNPAIAYTLRDSLAGVATMVSYLIGGYDWMKQCAPVIREWVHNEDLADYIHERDNT